MANREPKKDFAASHGMTHGSFRDYLKTHGEAKSSEQLATERAVADARSNVIAQQKVASIQAAGRKLDGSLLDKEVEAQAMRARALAHLQKHSCGPSSLERTGERAKTGLEDNTLEVLAKRNAKAKAADAAKGQALKEQLLKQQADLRRRLPSNGSGGGFVETEDEAEPDDGPLPSHWQEVAAPDGDGVYYWNELTNATSWERPKGTAAKQQQAAGSSSGSSSGAGAAGGPAAVGGAGAAAEALPAGWKKVYHEATGQVMYEHAVSLERRWAAPTAEGDKSDIQPKRPDGKSSGAPVKFSFGLTSAQTAAKRKAAASVDDRSGQGGQGKGGSKFEWQEKGKRNKVDPMDPTGAEAGAKVLSVGPNGERMADSTASGPLFQQRPYPAPGSVLRGQGK